MKKIALIVLFSIIFISGCTQSGPKTDFAGLAKDNISKNEFANALVNFKKAINQDPSDVSNYIAAAEILISKNNTKEAIELLKNGEGHTSDDAQLFEKIGDLYFLQSDYENSNNYYKKILNKVSGLKGTYRSLVALDRLDEAKSLLQNNRNNTDISTITFCGLYDESNMIGETKDIDEAKKIFQKLNEAKDDSKNLMELARFCINNGAASGAIFAVNKVIADNKYYEGGYLYRGLINLDLYRFEDARGDFRAAVSYNTNYALSFRYLGLAETRLNKLDTAKENFLTAISLEGDPSEDTLSDFLIYQRVAKDTEGAIETLTKLINFRSEHLTNYIYQLTEVYCLSDLKSTEAEKYLLSIESDPDFNRDNKSAITFIKGCIELKNSNINEAQELLDKEKLNNPNNLYTNMLSYLVAQAKNDSESISTAKDKIIDADLEGFFSDYVSK